MDQQVIQQLMQVFQQGLTLLQQAQQGGGMDMGGDDGGDMPPGGGAMPPGADDAAMGGGDPMAGDDGGDPMAGDDDQMGGDDGSLHDRVSQLEDHTGLSKSAGASLSDRIDALESQLLGELYEGPMPLRISQLQKAAGITSRQRRNYSHEVDAPDEIPLDSLIKSAIQSGIQQGLDRLAQQQGSPSGDLHRESLPSPASMRKAAGGTASFGQRKSTPPLIQGDADLVKAAEAWGFTDEDLDQPMSFGDILQAQFYAAQNGTELPMGDDDD